MKNITCTYCHAKFVNIHTLNNHQNTAKYCLSIQGKNNTNFECHYCKKVLSSKQNLDNHINKCETIQESIRFKCAFCHKHLSSKQNLFNHLVVCEEKKDITIEEKNSIIEEKETLIKVKDNEIFQLKMENFGYVKQINVYENEIKELRQTIERLGNRAIDKPTTTNTINNNLNITSSIDFNDIDKIKDIIKDGFDINYAVNGQKGLAQFVADKVLTDETGKLNYICTDPSRQIFKYKDKSGEIKKDVEAKKLTTYIVEGGIKQKAAVVTNEWYTDDVGKIDMNKFGIMVDKQYSILNIKDDNSIFKKELASITTT